MIVDLRVEYIVDPILCCSDGAHLVLEDTGLEGCICGLNEGRGGKVVIIVFESVGFGCGLFVEGDGNCLDEIEMMVLGG